MSASVMSIGLAVSSVIFLSAPALRAAPAPSPAALSPAAQEFSMSLGPGSHRDRLRRKPDLSYRAVSPAASVDERLSGWKLMRIEAMDADGWAKVGGAWIRAKSEGHYYANADAEEAEGLFMQAQQLRSQGIRCASLSPVYGAAAGGLIGAGVGLLQPAGAFRESGDYISEGMDRTDHAIAGFLVGTTGGALLGLGVGLWMEQAKARLAHGLRVQAAESFNQKLWQDLRLDAAPLPGGGALKLKARF